VLSVNLFKKKKFDLKQAEKSSTFCPIPFVSMMAQPGGTASFCCIAYKPLEGESGEVLRFEKDSFPSIWNSTALRGVREKMLAGEKVKECEHCYYQEKLGRDNSYRKSAIRDWMQGPMAKESLRRIQQAQEDDFSIKTGPLYLDLRMGNTCNLKCRMCQPFNSSSLYKEYKKISKQRPEFLEWIKQHTFDSNDYAVYQWQSSPTFWNGLLENMNDVRKIYLTGGEPTLIKENIKLVEHLCETKQASEIEIVLNTNCTTYDPGLIEKLRNFRRVLIVASLDGVGDELEYIRYPSRWAKIQKNIESLAGIGGNLNLMFSPVFQIYNVYHMPDLLRYVDQLKENFDSVLFPDIIMLDYPPLLDVRNLPLKIKEKALKKLENFESDSKTLIHEPRFSDVLESVKSQLRQPAPKGASKHLMEFFRYTEYFDRSRDQMFSKALPELYRDLLSEGVVDVSKEGCEGAL
jgi:MoaA/NifB/PqqE/SkfB family radical SAM enzyme